VFNFLGNGKGEAVKECEHTLRQYEKGEVPIEEVREACQAVNPEKINCEIAWKLKEEGVFSEEEVSDACSMEKGKSRFPFF